METREILLKADRIVVALERLEDGKTRATTASWDDHKGHPAQDDTGLVEAGYGPVTP